jgi:hypothetical protein
MIQEGKHKIQHLKQLGTISPEVMDKLHDIMKPIDERKNFKEYFQKKVYDEKKLEEKLKMKDSESIIERRIQDRRAKLERLLA